MVKKYVLNCRSQLEIIQLQSDLKESESKLTQQEKYIHIIAIAEQLFFPYANDWIGSLIQA